MSKELERVEVVDLAKVRPNPRRNFKVDPINPEKVEELKQLIDRDGFWSGIIARRVNGHLELAAGHHRLEAAKLAGRKTASITVMDYSDARMIRAYATENAVQRSTIGTAQAGSVASAAEYLLEEIFRGSSSEDVDAMGVTEKLFGGDGVSRAGTTNTYSLKKIHGNLQSEKGLGTPAIAKFLNTGEDGRTVNIITENAVRDQIAVLKDSGHYTAIVEAAAETVKAEQAAARKEKERLEREQREAAKREEEACAQREREKEKAEAARERERIAKADEDKRAMERAKRQREEAEAKRKEAAAREAEARAERKDAEEKLKASELKLVDVTDNTVKAAKAIEVVFDFDGVKAHLHDAKHIEVFRKAVTTEPLKSLITFKQQAKLAKKLVEKFYEANDEDKNISSAFITRELALVVEENEEDSRKADTSRAKAIRAADIQGRVKQHADNIRRCFDLISREGHALAKLLGENPEAVAYVNKSFIHSMESAKRAIIIMQEKF
jgi:hypothetical protein